jgi:4-hydroxythreonine-4-phosphate dehydrogenase
LAFGPFAADGFWGSGQYSKFDGILAMYHDQGLAPFKTIAMESGINYTAGLPYVRTSPDHGTGYDIAGKGVANEDSMRQAIYSAIDILRNRRRHAEATRNPLRRQYYEKGSDNVVLDLTKDVDED